MVFFVYVLKNAFNGNLYKGHTADLAKRLQEHNSGKNRSTKPFIPWKLVYYEEFTTRIDAVKREKYFKSGSGREFLKLLLTKQN